MPNQVKIIGGKWRSRIIKFSSHSTLRPTPNVARETLFNWLSPIIRDANCLDLFSGSGALGFEALSRGAKHVVMVDQSQKVINNLRENAKLLGADDITFVSQKISPQLSNIFKKKFNIVFLDPPFNQNIIMPICFWLEEIGCFMEEAYIYIETESQLKVINVPSTWQLLRHKITGLVQYALFIRKSNEQVD